MAFRVTTRCGTGRSSRRKRGPRPGPRTGAGARTAVGQTTCYGDRSRVRRLEARQPQPGRRTCVSWPWRESLAAPRCPKVGGWTPVPFPMTLRDGLAESGRPPGAPGWTMCIEHLKWTCAPAVQPPMDAPWGVCAAERQYRDRQASRRAHSIRQGEVQLEAGMVRGCLTGGQGNIRRVCSTPSGRCSGNGSLSTAAQGCRRWRTGCCRSGRARRGEIGVAIETPRGPVVESLMERGFAVHSINPEASSTVSGTASRRRARRTTGAMRGYSPRRCVPTRTVYDGWNRPTGRSLNCGSGRVSTMT